MKRALSTAVLAILLAACAPQPSSPQIGDLCVGMAALQASVEAFRALEPSASNVDDYQAAMIAISRSLADVREQAYALADARATEVTQAIDDLQSAVDDIPNDANLTDAVASLEDEVQAVSDAVTALNDEVNCPG